MHRHRWLKWSELVDGHNGHKLQFRVYVIRSKGQALQHATGGLLAFGPITQE